MSETATTGAMAGKQRRLLAGATGAMAVMAATAGRAGKAAAVTTAATAAMAARACNDWEGSNGGHGGSDGGDGSNKKDWCCKTHAPASKIQIQHLAKIAVHVNESCCQ